MWHLNDFVRTASDRRQLSWAQSAAAITSWIYVCFASLLHRRVEVIIVWCSSLVSSVWASCQWWTTMLKHFKPNLSCCAEIYEQQRLLNDFFMQNTTRQCSSNVPSALRLHIVLYLCGVRKKMSIDKLITPTRMLIYFHSFIANHKVINFC